MAQIVCVNLVRIDDDWACVMPGKKPRKCKVRAAVKTCCSCAYLRQADKHRCRPCASALAAVRASYQVVGQEQPAQASVAASAQA